jgi:type I restriction enzyme M protein
MNNFSDKVSFIWSVADLLRGPYKPNQYGKVILPLTVLRRLDCVLEPTRQKVRDKADELKRKGTPISNLEPVLNRAAMPSDWPKDRPFPLHNTSKFDFQALKGDPNNIAKNLTHYIKNFSSKAREIIEYFGFAEQIEKLDKANRLYLVVSKFADIDLHPGAVSNVEMGYIFEELIRKFSEAANETAGDHFTPREVIRLIVNALFSPDGDVLTKKGIVRTLFDPACGTGGMLSVAEEYLKELNPDARLEVFGQDYNPESYAICGSDMLIKGQNIDHIKFGDSFTDDGFASERYDYLLANPPFGVEWKPEEDEIRKEHESLKMSGRFGAGLPRINDGSLLFLQHMISKMKPIDKGGSRVGIVFNGSPLFTGDAGSGESEIRRWIIENDWLETIIALPDELFYNTGIFTYVWIVTNRKDRARRGKVQLINAVSLAKKMRKSLGNKRQEIGDEHIEEITRIYGECRQSPISKIFDNDDFGYRKITIERPLRLRFEVTEGGVAALRASGAFMKLAESEDDAPKKRGRKTKGSAPDAPATPASPGVGEPPNNPVGEAIVDVLRSLPSGKVWMDRAAFLADLDEAADAADTKIPAPVRKAIVATIGVRDEAAEICRDADGNPEPDADLRDYESVPLKEDILVYFDREVKPHVPDAWISTDDKYRDHKDGKVGIIGYEIPITRHFYVYQPPRALSEIASDIAGLEKSIVQMLAEVTR